MGQVLHGSATPTKAIRRAIQHSQESLRTLARRYGINQKTVWDIRSDNGPELVAKALRDWIAAVGAKTAYIEPGSPWENGYVESFNGKLRDELLKGEIFFTLKEAAIMIEAWRRH